MIATILPGSADFHAVGYNEHKVYKGVATLLEMQNFGGLDASEHPTAKQLVQFLKFYSSQNSRIQKPQFHVAQSMILHYCLQSIMNQMLIISSTGLMIPLKNSIRYILQTLSLLSEPRRI